MVGADNSVPRAVAAKEASRLLDTKTWRVSWVPRKTFRGTLLLEVPSR